MKLSKIKIAINKLNKLGIFSLNDIDNAADFNRTSQSRFTWLKSKVGDAAIWIMNDAALKECVK